MRCPIRKLSSPKKFPTWSLRRTSFTKTLTQVQQRHAAPRCRQANPFAASDEKKPVEQKPESALDLLAKKKASEKEESPGLLSSLWPFGGDKAKNEKKTPDGKNSQLVASVDDSLKGKGVDANLQTTSLNPPAADLASIAQPAPVQKSDTNKLLGDIDANLKKGGTSVGSLPAPPEPAEVFRNPAAAQAIVTAAKPEELRSPTTSGLLSSIDQKLKNQGVEPAKLDLPPVATIQNAPRQEAPKRVELDSKLTMEKGPLFLTPAEIPSHENAPTPQAPALAEEKKAAPTEKASAEPANRDFARNLVKGPTQLQAQAPTQKPADAKKPDEENKGVLDQLESKTSIRSVKRSIRSAGSLTRIVRGSGFKVQRFRPRFRVIPSTPTVARVLAARESCCRA